MPATFSGLIRADDFSDHCYSTKKVREGCVLNCKVKTVDKEEFYVLLSSKKSELGRKLSVSETDPSYKVDKVKVKVNLRNEQEKARKEKERAKDHFAPRKIGHPCFENCTADEAMQHLSDKEAGHIIICPISKGPSFLTLTINFFDGVYSHKDIVEGGKCQPDDITSPLWLGKPLTIDSETFDDLNEVIDRYVDPLVKYLKNMLGYRKFKKGNEAEVDELLKAEKDENPKTIVYCFGISHERPGTFILSYFTSNLNPHHEYIALYPKGFRFREMDFEDLDHLVYYFQRNTDTAPPEAGPSVRTVRIDGRKRKSRNMGFPVQQLCLERPSTFIQGHPMFKARRTNKDRLDVSHFTQ